MSSRLETYKKQAKQLIRWHRDGNHSIGGRIRGPAAFGEAVLISLPFVNAPPSPERTYDTTTDKRVLGLRTDAGPNGRPVSPQVEVVLNWFEDLNQRVPISPRRPR
jgi:hypothetical protein